jgi:hypothetical protein
MQGEDQPGSLKKFSAIALVLMLGIVFHTLCWSSLLKRNGVIERPSVGLSCPCVIDQRYDVTATSAAMPQGNCARAAQEALVSTH